MIRSDTVREVLLRRLVLSSEVYGLIDSNAVAIMSETVKRIGIVHEPIFQVQADGSLRQLTGRKRIASALKLRLPSVRIRIVDCDEKDAELLVQTEKSYKSGDALEQQAARRKVNDLIALVSPALPASTPVIRRTPKRVAREMIALQLDETLRTVSDRQRRKARLEREAREMVEHPERKPFIMALRAAKTIAYHLGCARTEAREHGMPQVVELAQAALDMLNEHCWPKGPCCMQDQCPKCDGRGWIAGERIIRRGRPVGAKDASPRAKPDPPPPEEPYDWVDW